MFVACPVQVFAQFSCYLKLVSIKPHGTSISLLQLTCTAVGVPVCGARWIGFDLGRVADRASDSDSKTGECKMQQVFKCMYMVKAGLTN